MSAPFFSVLLPTRNRAEIVGGAIQSALGQTFRDLEIVLCDNDDDGTATHEAVAEISDERLRYVRTGGLSMCDNWDHALEQARGRHVLVLEDKQRLVPNALEILHHHLEQLGDVPVKYGLRFAATETIAGPAMIPPAKRHDCREIIDLYCRFSYRSYALLPKGLDSTVPRDLAMRLKAESPTSHFFSYVNPDYASAFQVLGAVESIFVVESALVYIPNNWMWGSRYSTGLAAYNKAEAARDYLAGLPFSEEEYLAQMPVKAPHLWVNAVLFDFHAFYKCKDHKPVLDWAGYHALCWLVIHVFGRKLGANMSGDSKELRKSLRRNGLGFRLRYWWRVWTCLAALAWQKFRGGVG